MSKKVMVVCDACDALFLVGKYDEVAQCPKCHNYVDIMGDGFDDRRFEDENV